MKKTMLTLAVGMGAGMYAHSYISKHPIKSRLVVKNIKDMMKDM